MTQSDSHSVYLLYECLFIAIVVLFLWADPIFRASVYQFYVCFSYISYVVICDYLDFHSILLTTE